VVADFDDDSGQVRVSVTNNMQVQNYGGAVTGGSYSYAVVSTLAYDVSILAAVAGD
jgi:hypothetical protein